MSSENPGSIALTEKMDGWITDVGNDGPRIRRIINHYRNRFRGDWKVLFVTQELLNSHLLWSFDAPHLVEVIVFYNISPSDISEIKKRYSNANTFCFIPSA